MKKIYSFAFFILALASTSVYADKNGYYVEAAYEKRYSEDTSSYNVGTWNFSSTRFIFGKVISEHWAIEGLLTQGITSDKKAYSSSLDVQSEISTSYGFAIRPFIKITDNIELYGRIGLNKENSKITTLYNSTIISTKNNTENVNFWSLGAAYNIIEDFSATFDYIKMQHSTIYQVDIKKYTFGIRYDF